MRASNPVWVLFHAPALKVSQNGAQRVSRVPNPIVPSVTSERVSMMALTGESSQLHTQLPGGVEEFTAALGLVTVEDLEELFRGECRCEARHMERWSDGRTTKMRLPCSVRAVAVAVRIGRPLPNTPIGSSRLVCQAWIQSMVVTHGWSIRPI